MEDDANALGPNQEQLETDSKTPEQPLQWTEQDTQQFQATCSRINKIGPSKLTPY